MKKLMSLVLGLSVAGLMAACGGGDDGPTTTSVADKYAGTYKDGCEATGSTGSKSETLTITKTSDTTLSFSFADSTYASNNCSGTPTKTESGTGTATFRGTKTIGADTVDKLDIVENGVLQKNVLVIKNGVLFSGRSASDGGPVDSDGYPTTLETGGITKQSTTAATSTPDPTAATSVADKYVGTWSDGCRTIGSTGSEKEMFTISKTSDTSINFVSVNSIYASNNCSGTPTRTDSGTGTGTFRGTKAIGADTVDKIDLVFVEGSRQEKQVLVIKNGMLFSGRTARDGGAVDSDGYPTTLDTAGGTKQ